MEGADNDLAKLMYEDINEISIELEFKRLQREHDDLLKRYDAVLVDNNDLKNQISKISTEKCNIEKNIVTLYNTALKEISRKDKEILSLTTELEISKAQMRR